MSGLVERVTFFNEETGFTVLKVKVKGHRDEVAVVGSLPSANPGEWVTAEGQWVQDRQFGRQFRADLITCTAPTTREGVEKYLGSGLVKGIGPVYAHKLVQKFGERIFDIIENFSARLEEVDGIGPTRRRVIKDAWAAQKVIRAIMVFLHSNGVSTSRAVRIYKTYGENAIERVREDPYRLARDIPGVGFATADKIAVKLGIPHDSVLRACAGLEHLLAEAAGQGHCALPSEHLREQSQELLAVPEEVLSTAFEKARQDRLIEEETIAGESLAFLPHLKRAEESIAAKIGLLGTGSVSYPAINLEKAVQWCQEKTGQALAQSQVNALRDALTHRLLVITGGPGVGKTTLMNTILRVLRAKQVRCLLCAPTGRAARRLSESTGVEARTIHRLLEIDGRSGGFKRKEANPLECDLLVLDEASMVDVPLMNAVLRALPPAASLILVGDVDQLPSVGPGLVLRDFIKSGVMPVARLTEVFRQAANSQIVTNAHRMNTGLMPVETPDEHSDFFLIERDDPERIVSTLVEVVKRRIPARFNFDPRTDVQVLCPMNRGSLGVNEINSRLQAELNPLRPGEPVVEKFGVQFRSGDKVMQTENNYDKEVFNGDIGQIVSIDPAERELRVQYDQRQVMYEFAELDELVLAYAITIHKSQGSEFPVVVIPLATQHYMMLQRNLVYTGVTRGRKVVVIIGQKKALSMAIRNNRTEHRFSGLGARLAALRSGGPNVNISGRYCSF